MAVLRASLIALALVASACSDTVIDESAIAEEAPAVEPRELWMAERPDRYRLTTRVECFCDQLPAWLDIVDGNESVAHVELLSGVSAPFGPTGPRTMESLFAFADELARDSTVDVTTDPTTGAIRRLAVDPLPDSDDDEWVLIVELVSLASDQSGIPPALPSDVDPASLTEPLECSHAFGVVNADRTQSILVSHFETPPIEPAFRDMALPHHQWEVRVVVGETPSGAGCNSATSAERVAEAHAVGGRLTVTEPGEDVCDANEIRIDDLEIDDGRGGRTQLGSVTVRGVFGWACDRFG